MRCGPHTKSKVGTCEDGTLAGVPPFVAADETEAETDPTKPTKVSAAGNCSISIAARRVDTPLTVASAAATGLELPSAIMSVASRERVKEKVSPGTVRAARGSPPDCGRLGISPGAAVQPCVIVSGLNWNTMTLGIARMTVGINEISAPFMNSAGIGTTFSCQSWRRGLRYAPQLPRPLGANPF